MYLDLIQTASLMVALTALYSLVSRLKGYTGYRRKIFLGLLFGAVAIVGMQLPFHYSPGVIYDGRAIIMAMAGLFGGGITAFVSMILAGAYRAQMGGVGVWAGLATIIGCAGVGLAFRRGYGNRPDRMNILLLYGFGLSVHLIMLACQLLIQPWPAGLAVINRIWLPILLIFPISTVLVGFFLGTEERRIKAEEELLKYRDHLEDLVKARMEKLAKSNQLLQAEITYRKQVEKALHQSESQLRLMIEKNPDGIVLMDSNGIILFVNPVAEALFGYKAESLVNISLGLPLFSKETTEIDLPRKGTCPGVAEMRSTQILWNGEGASLISLRDITDRKRMEAELADQARELQKINTAMFVQNETIVRINRATAGFVQAMTIEETCTILTRTLIEEFKIPKVIMGLKRGDDTFEFTRSEGLAPAISRQEILNCLFCVGAIPLVLKKGRRVMKQELSGDGSACAGLFADCSFWPIKGKKEILGILVLDSPDKEKADTLSMFLNQAGTFLETVMLYQDMASMNEKILAANQRLKEIDVQKSNFLNIVAHDLRTPLTSIRSYADLLLMYKDESAETREEFLTIISQESVRLGNLINDFLDLSRIESGTMKYSIKATDLKGLITHTLSVFQGEAARKNIALTKKIDPGLPEIMADGDRLGQVLANLLSNAIKFTPRGGAVSINARSIADHEVEITVTDTGNGIDSKDHNKIFEKFGQMEGRGDGKIKGGTGLGLTISKEIVEKHGGRIWVESKLGRGARFVVILPVRL